MTTVQTTELNDAEWADQRDAVAQQFLGMSADEFVARYHSGAFDGEEPDGLMAVLAFFPELD